MLRVMFFIVIAIGGLTLTGLLVCDFSCKQPHKVAHEDDAMLLGSRLYDDFVRNIPTSYVYGESDSGIRLYGGGEMRTSSEVYFMNADFSTAQSMAVLAWLKELIAEIIFTLPLPREPGAPPPPALAPQGHITIRNEVEDRIVLRMYSRNLSDNTNEVSYRMSVAVSNQNTTFEGAIFLRECTYMKLIYTLQELSE